MFNRIAKIISGLLSAAIIFTSPSFGKIALPSAAAEEPDEEALRLLWEEYLDGLPPVADIVPGPYCAALLLEDGSVQLCGVADDGSGYCRFDTREWKNMKKLDSLPNEDVPLLAGLTAEGEIRITGHVPDAWCDTGDWKDVQTLFCGDTGEYYGGAYVAGITTDGSLRTAGILKMRYDWMNSAEARAEWNNLKTISCAESGIYGLRQDGTVLKSGGRFQLDNWSDLTDLAVFDVYAAGLRADGSVLFEFGHYIIYDSEVRSAEEFENLSEWENMISLAGNNDHLLGLRADGRVQAAGLNEYGQCDVEAWETVTAVAAGKQHSAALLEDGTVVAAGDNSRGQCDVAGWTDVVQIAAMDYATVGLRRDGSVISTETEAYQSSEPDDPYAVEPLDLSALEEIVSIGAGSDFVAGLRKDGTVTVIGRRFNIWNELAEWKNMRDVAVGYSAGEFLPDNDMEGCFLAGLQEDGTVRLLYPSTSRWTSTVLDWQDIVAIEAGGISDTAFLLGLKADGTVESVGAECGVEDWKQVASIHAGDSLAIGICEDGTVRIGGNTKWLDPRVPETVENWTGIRQVSYGYSSFVGLKEDGTVVSVDNGEEKETCDWREIEKILTAYRYICGIDRNGRLRYAGCPCFGTGLLPDWFMEEGLLPE